MAEYLIQESTLTGIADAIREKTGNTDKINPLDMPAQIAELSGGDLPPPVESISIVSSGTEATVTFTLLDEEGMRYLGNPAYVLVLKQDEIPKSPTDGTVVKFDRSGEVIE